MTPAICLVCRRSFRPDPRTAAFQKTCSREACQRTRQRAKLCRWRELHPAFARNYAPKVRAWAKAYPGYWRLYRREHPGYAERDNRRRCRAARRARRSANETAMARISREKLAALEALQNPSFSANETPIRRRVELVVDYLLWKARSAKETPMASLPAPGA